MIDQKRAYAAAVETNKQLQKWMPQDWLNRFIEEYNRTEKQSSVCDAEEDNA